MDVHVGDIIVDEGDIYGDGVNIAARLESMATPGGIAVSGRVYEDVAGELDLAFRGFGPASTKKYCSPSAGLCRCAKGTQDGATNADHA